MTSLIQNVTCPLGYHQPLANRAKASPFRRTHGIPKVEKTRATLPQNAAHAMNGVIILALKKQAYAGAAFNLALSIKHYNQSTKITLLTDNIHRGCFRPEHYAVFDNITEIADEDCTNRGNFCPAKAKLSLYKYSNYQRSLYLDADSICLKHLDPLFEHLKGHAFKSQKIKSYTQWTDADTFKTFFDVEPGQTINSSWIYFENDAVFRQAERFYAKAFPLERLEQKWGSSLPDELFFNAALEKLKVDSASDVPVMYFDFSGDTRSMSQLMTTHYFITFYGNASSTRPTLREWYDKYLYELCAHEGIEHRFKICEIIAHKHIDNPPADGDDAFCQPSS
jgi:hypothetical protein